MTTKPAKLKPPSEELAALSLKDSEGAVRADELEAFRREWRAEVAKAKVVAVDAGGVRWKGAPEEARDKGKDKEKHEEAKDGQGHEAESGEEAWPEAPTSPKLANPRSPTTPRSPTKEPRSPPKIQLRSPTKATPRSLAKSTSSWPAAPAPPKAPAVEAGSPADSDSDTMPFPQRRRTGDAVGLYTRAVEAEQGGRLSDALHLYRKAFRADDNVDKLYALKQRKADAALAPTSTIGAAPVSEVATPTPADIVDPTAPELPEYKFTREVQVSPDYERVVGHVSRLTALLEKRVGVFQDDEDEKADSKRDPAATFRPADAALPLPLSTLPSELVDRILTFLDVGGVERFAQTCWRARLLTATCGAWRRLGERIYRPPMGELAAAALAKRHMGEWRTTLVEEERIRMDGAYIAVCHYIRPGAGEQWVTITHMITYHRFLRFYPDGHVISFLTTDHPSDVVPLLKPALRAKGLHFGRWRLIRAEDERGRKRPRVLVSELIEPGVEPKYEFEMELSLRETGRGRWNKLDLVSYSSINLATGEALGLSLKHQKPFYFSKVRSYNPPF